MSKPIALFLAALLLIALGVCGAPAPMSPPQHAAVPSPAPSSSPMPTASSAPTARPTSKPTRTPVSFATPTPTTVPITEEEVLAGYRAWIVSWSEAGGDVGMLTEDPALAAMYGRNCREAPFHMEPRVVEISQAEATARVWDALGYYVCDPNFGRSKWQDTGYFTLARRDGVWKLVSYERAVTPTPIPPTRDPNAPMPAPPPTARTWSPADLYELAHRAVETINQFRAQNGVAAVQYAEGLQAPADLLARRFYETNRALSQEEIDAILQPYGAIAGYMINNVTLQNTAGCRTMDENGHLVPYDSTDPATIYCNARWETQDARLRRMVIGVYGPYAGTCGPSVTLAVVGSYQ